MENKNNFSEQQQKRIIIARKKKIFGSNRLKTQARSWKELLKEGKHQQSKIISKKANKKMQ